MLYNKYKNQIYQQNQEKMVRPRISTSESDSSVPYADASPAYSPPYDPNNSPAYDPNASPAYNPDSGNDAKYSPHTPDEPPTKLSRFEPHSPDEPPPIAAIEGIKIKNSEVKTEFDALPERDKIMLMKMAAEQRAKKNKEGNEKEEVKVAAPVMSQAGGDSEQITSILKIEEEKPESEKETTETDSTSSSGTKSVSFDTGSSGSDGVKQIIL